MLKVKVLCKNEGSRVIIGSGFDYHIYANTAHTSLASGDRICLASVQSFQGPL